jgi:hypothetical protein
LSRIEASLSQFANPGRANIAQKVLLLGASIKRLLVRRYSCSTVLSISHSFLSREVSNNKVVYGQRFVQFTKLRDTFYKMDGIEVSLHFPISRQVLRWAISASLSSNGRVQSHSSTSFRMALSQKSLSVSRCQRNRLFCFSEASFAWMHLIEGQPDHNPVHCAQSPNLEANTKVV